MRLTVDIPTTPDSLERWIDTLARENETWLRQQRTPPPSIYDGGVRYRDEGSAEIWLTLPQVLARGYADCEDLVAARVAELRARGQYARPRVVRISPTLSHTYIEHPDGRAEDPSARLGMPAPPLAVLRNLALLRRR